MSTKAIRPNCTASDLLHPAQRQESWHQLATAPATNGRVADPNQMAKLGQGKALLDKVISDMHAAICTPNVNLDQDLCAHLPPNQNMRRLPFCAMHEHLRAWRDAAGLTLKEVANRLGTSHATVSRWETGVQAIPPKKFQQLAAVYEATPAEMLVGPADRVTAKRFHVAAQIIGQLDAEQVEQWLAVGRSLAAANERSVRKT